MAEGAEKGSFVRMQEEPGSAAGREPGSMAGRGSEASYQRGRSLMSTASSGRPKKKGWEQVAQVCKSGALQFVGLKQSREEELHWGAVQESIKATQARKAAGPPSLQQQASIRSIQRGGSILEAPASHISRYPYTTPTASVGRVVSDGEAEGGESLTVLRSGSIYDKGTGRNQAVRTELKPDLWKLAYTGVLSLTRQAAEKAKKAPLSTPGMLPSFPDLEDEEEEEGVEETDFAGRSIQPAFMSLAPIAEHDEDFFGEEFTPRMEYVGEDQPDAAIARVVPRIPVKPVPPPEEERLPRPAPAAAAAPPPEKRVKRNRIVDVITDPLIGGYDRGYGGLGLPSRLLQIKYKEIPDRVLKELDKSLLHKRPYFTYWLLVVHIVIVIVSLSVYGFAPYGWDIKTEREIVLTSQVIYSSEEKQVIRSVWGGPRQQDLVILGALYAPCMRKDRKLFDAIDEDRNRERFDSGCCVRRDGSGCYQVVDREQDCAPGIANFVFLFENDTRGVCGTAPQFCDDPSPQIRDDDTWVLDNILTWPICDEKSDQSVNDSLPEHLQCELTGRPCCVGIQAQCLITTREHCDFLDGRFHQEAFLCSQVDCLNDTCGLLPFLDFNEPDQVYRLWIALFLHAGIIHVLFTTLFIIFVLRIVEKRLGWLRTTFVYVLSGIGGNLVSVYFVPYNPEVGPAGSILGIVAYFFIFLIFEWRLLVAPWMEFIKLFVVVAALLVIGLFPFVNNIAHIGGLVFGFFLSGIVVPYKDLRGIVDQSEKKEGTTDVFKIIKIVLICMGIPAVLALFLIFLILFYAVQDTWEGFSYVTCIPFTETLCLDGRDLRDRGENANYVV